MFFHQRFVPGLAIYSYMVGDEKSKQCAVIDPTRDVDEYLEIARREGLRVTHVLETHVHADFVSGSAELKARLGDEVRGRRLRAWAVRNGRPPTPTGWSATATRSPWAPCG